MFIVIWEYELRPGGESAFEALYSVNGAWTTLFRGHAGYLGTELLRDERLPRYLTIDRWCCASEYDAFLASDRTRYADIDAQGDTLTLSERRVGRYDVLT